LRIGYISDLHLDFRTKILSQLQYGNVPEALSFLGFPEEIEADLVVIAGDICEDKNLRDWFLSVLRTHYSVEFITVMGNHDRYNTNFPGPTEDTFVIERNGLKIAGCTLWTKLGVQRPEWNWIADVKYIYGFNSQKWNAVHAAHEKFLADNNPDIIVTHHCPTPKHIHPKYAGDALNEFFSSDFDLTTVPNCKLWVSGHTHTEFDFVHAGIRFVVNPLGYPGENYGVKMKFLDI
jgi:predicted phosphodiesterase